MQKLYHCLPLCTIFRASSFTVLKGKKIQYGVNSQGNICAHSMIRGNGKSYCQGNKENNNITITL